MRGAVGGTGGATSYELSVLQEPGGRAGVGRGPVRGRAKPGVCLARRAEPVGEVQRAGFGEALALAPGDRPVVLGHLLGPRPRAAAWPRAAAAMSRRYGHEPTLRRHPPETTLRRAVRFAQNAYHGANI